MPTTSRSNRVEVSSTGPLTLDELERVCADARREHIPGTTVARIAAQPGAGQNLGFVHDFAPHGADAPTEVLVVPAIRPSHPHLNSHRPSTGRLV